MTAALALASTFAVSPANAIETLTLPVANATAVVAATASQPQMTAMTTRVQASMTDHHELSELPEPEVIAMLLVGLVLIGYRASRDTNEKFK